MRTENRVLNSVTINHHAKTIEVQWDIDVMEGSELIGSRPHRCVYGQINADQFIADVPDGQRYVNAVWW